MHIVDKATTCQNEVKQNIFFISLQWRYKEQNGVPNNRRFDQRITQAQIKEKNKAPLHWRLWEEFNGLLQIE